MAQTTTTPLKRYFVGYSTQNSAKTGIRTFYDIELVTIDLMASFQTRIGERVMRPDWGCNLYQYIMEPMTQDNRNAILAEVERIVSLDTRLQVINVQLFELDHGFRIEATLNYVPWAVISTFTATFVNNEAVYFGSNTAANNFIT